MFLTAASLYKYFPLRLLAAALILLATSCTTVRNYPAERPFVFETNVALEGKYSTEERKQLVSQLQQQLHDSITARRLQKLIFFESVPNPPLYDSLNADKSVVFMRALLQSLGYTRDTITYDTTLKVVQGDQYRTTVNFNVRPGKLIRLDSIAYNLRGDTLVEGDSVAIYPGSDTLQQLTLANIGQSQLRKGTPFAKPLISAEFDRLANLYRDNGYLRFSREELLAVWDTLDIELLRPTFDPVEQARLLEELRRRRENPTADLVIRLRANRDTSHLVRYHVGNITVYPDLGPDTAAFYRTVRIHDGVRFISYADRFKTGRLNEYIYLKEGDLFRQSNYLRTLNKFNAIDAWRLVTIEQVPRPGQDTVDFRIKLTPARKYAYSATLEGSRNQRNLLSEGNLLGIGLSLGLQNRNFLRGANAANTNFRYGIELNAAEGRRFVQTRQITLSNNFFFPRMVPRFDFLPQRVRENVRTIFSLNAGTTNRVDFFNLISFNSSWGYELGLGKSLLSIRMPNIEYNYLTRGPQLDTLIRRNASFQYIFNTGLVTSNIITLSRAGGRENLTHLTRINVETSGLLTGLIRSPLLDDNLYRFLKLDADYRRTRAIRRTALAWRVLGGVGYALPSANHKNAGYMPFFRQYYAGGPNSMRAWGLRKLGPGSMVRSFADSIAPERFGDIQFEANGEYRFYITDVNGVTLNSALFADIGNVWYLRDDPTLDDEVFDLNKLWKDLAIGIGTCLRVDFGFLKVRLDYAYKLKDPSPDAELAQGQNKFFFYNWKPGRATAENPRGARIQLGIDYPF